VPHNQTLATLSNGRVDHGDRTIIRDATLSIRSGSLTLVTGPNGGGKSTLLAVLAGIHQLSAGELQIAEGARRAFVPQRSASTDSLPLTVTDVVRMGRWFRTHRRRPEERREDRAITSECLSAVGLVGLEKTPLAALSGGQRQRAFLAQGLAQRADVLLLDEPAAGLDHSGRLMLSECIAAERRRGAAVVLVTHDQDHTADATQHIHIADGSARVAHDSTRADPLLADQ
jgi:zinc/manganese transport system ATP-binding protein